MVHLSSDSNELGNETQDVPDVSNPELLQANPPVEVTPSNLIEPDARGDEGGDEESVVSIVKYYPEQTFKSILIYTIYN